MFVPASTLLPDDVADQPPLGLHPLPQSGRRRRLQQPDHGGDDAAALDEVDLPLEDGRRVAVEAQDEAALHLQPGALDALDVRHQVAAHVLLLVALGQAVLLGRLDADEDAVKPRLDHQLHQLRRRRPG